jgi:hypothetical protein
MHTFHLGSGTGPRGTRSTDFGLPSTLYRLDTGSIHPGKKMCSLLDSTHTTETQRVLNILRDTLNRDLLHMTSGHLGNLYKAPRSRHWFDLRDTECTYHPPMRKTQLDRFRTQILEKMTTPPDTMHTSLRIHPLSFRPGKLNNSLIPAMPCMIRLDKRHIDLLRGMSR